MSANNGQVGLPLVHEIQPGDGWRYSVLVADLPHDGFMGGGSAEEYCVVTVWLPTDPIGQTYVMAKNGTLTTRYVAEKFGRHGSVPAEIIRHVAEAIRGALGRPGLSSDDSQ